MSSSRFTLSFRLSLIAPTHICMVLFCSRMASFIALHIFHEAYVENLHFLGLYFSAIFMSPIFHSWIRSASWRCPSHESCLWILYAIVSTRLRLYFTNSFLLSSPFFRISKKRIFCSSLIWSSISQFLTPLKKSLCKEATTSNSSSFHFFCSRRILASFMIHSTFSFGENKRMSSITFWKSVFSSSINNCIASDNSFSRILSRTFDFLVRIFFVPTTGSGWIIF